MTEASRQIFDGSSKPYQRRVQWLGSNGVAFINTGIRSSGGIEFEIDGIATFNGVVAENAQWLFGYDSYFIGSQTRSDSILFGNGTVGQTARWFSYGEYRAVGDDAFYQPGRAWPSTQTIYRFKDLVYSENGNVLTTFAKKDFDGGDMYLFALNQVGNQIKGHPNAKIFGCRIWKDGNLVRDFIPVVANGKGAMFDKVSKQMFGSIGSGDFEIGPDLA